MATHADRGTGTHAPERAEIPIPLPARSRRRHDRTKYPWRQQRRRRKVIQVTLVSSLALLFLCGALYVMLASSRSGGSTDGESSQSARPTKHLTKHLTKHPTKLLTIFGGAFSVA